MSVLQTSRKMRLAFGIIGPIASVILPTAASAVAFQIGDVFAGVGDGFIKHFDNAGTFIETLDSGIRGTATTGMAFDSSGNLYATMFTAGQVVKFDSTGNLVGGFGGGFNLNPESIVFDAAGNVFVGQVNGSADVLKFDGAGNALGSFDVAIGPIGSDWIDLSADQKMLLYSSEGTTIRAFDISTNTQLADFSNALDTAFALRILGDGGVLVANGGSIPGVVGTEPPNVKRLDSSGNVIQTYTAAAADANFLFALNLDPDGTSFWTAAIITGNVFRFDIDTGALLDTFNAGILGNSLGGLAVFGEVTQATVPEPSALALLGIGLLGLSFKRRGP